MSPVFIELVVSVLYVLFGLVIGNIARSRAWLYALIPPFVVRGAEVVLLYKNSQGLLGHYPSMFFIISLTSSLVGANIGIWMRRIRRPA